MEDTKTLVAGAASSQEQLAVAAQNAVTTIVQLSDVVKNGATSLGSPNQEAQVVNTYTSYQDIVSQNSVSPVPKMGFGFHLFGFDLGPIGTWGLGLGLGLDNKLEEAY